MGKLFVIDGTDGSGKQTQLNKLKERFDKEGINYKSVSFPNYDSPSSTLVKIYLNGELSENPNDISPYIASTFVTFCISFAIISFKSNIFSPFYA